MSVLHKFKSIFKKDAQPPGSPHQGSAASSSGGGGPHIWPMSDETKAQLARGVKYNLRIAIRGMRKVGKTSLMARLTGRPVDVRKYTPTPEIAAATIYFAAGGGADSSEGAKIELWDIVDEAAAPAQGTPGKKGSPAAPPVAAADASTVDVYRGCTAVIFVVDATRRETFDYVARLLPDVPPTVAVLVALNFSDCDEGARAVADRDVDELCRSSRGAATKLVLEASRGQAPPEGFAAAASWMPCSMATGVGVDAVRAFFDIPFALAQLDALEGAMRGLYRGVDAVRADMLQRRAEARFASRQASSAVSAASGSGSWTQGSPSTSAPAAAAKAGPSSKSAEPPAAAPTSKQAPANATPVKPTAEPTKPAEQAPKPIASRDATGEAGSGGGGVNDSFFGDDVEEEEAPAAESTDSESESEGEPPRQLSASGSRGRSPTQNQPPPPAPAAAMPAVRSRGSESSLSQGIASPAPREPSPAPEPATVEEPVPASLPPPERAASTAAEPSAPTQVSNDVNVVDTSVLEPARVDDDFFGGGDDDADDGDDAEAAPEDDGVAEETSAAPAAVAAPAPQPQPEPAKEATVDVTQLLAQMQSALEAPVAQDDEAAEDEAPTREKKSKKDKHDKKDKKDKKKDKKEKKSKKAAEYAEEEDDDLQVLEA